MGVVFTVVFVNRMTGEVVNIVNTQSYGKAKELASQVSDGYYAKIVESSQVVKGIGRSEELANNL